jgi:hypothetical protein
LPSSSESPRVADVVSIFAKFAAVLMMADVREGLRDVAQLALHPRGVFFRQQSDLVADGREGLMAELAMEGGQQP